MTEKEIQSKLTEAKRRHRIQYPYNIPKFFKPLFDWYIRIQMFLCGYSWGLLKYMQSQRWVEITREDIIIANKIAKRYGKKKIRRPK